MTPRRLIQYLQDLPEELKDVDLEYATKFEELKDGFSVRPGQYIDAIAFNVDDREVLLMSLETAEKMGIFPEDEKKWDE